MDTSTTLVRPGPAVLVSSTETPNTGTKDVRARPQVVLPSRNVKIGTMEEGSAGVGLNGATSDGGPSPSCYAQWEQWRKENGVTVSIIVGAIIFSILSCCASPAGSGAFANDWSLRD